MRLCAIFIVWDDYEILRYAIDSIANQVEGIIVVASTESNTGEFSPIPEDFYENPYFDLFIKNPDLKKQKRENETEKRNFGIDKALQEGYTHFIMLDADEFYPDFRHELKRFENTDLLGLVCDSVLYFKSPTLCFDDRTRVPFIHRLTSNLRFEKNYDYPFSTDKDFHPVIDPTRTMNLTGGIEQSGIKMHHMSYVRSDIQKKIRNSAGHRVNQFGFLILDDMKQAKEGYHLQFFNKTLRRVPNLFNLPDLGSAPTSAQFGQAQ